jgi:D-threo-aldose 1-dehydrogenase
MSSLALERRQLGRTKVSVTALGFGAAAIGNLYRPVLDEAARSVVEGALRAGIGYFDTAPYYGFGLSEMRLGEVLKAQATVSTKVGRVLVPDATATVTQERHGFFSPRPFKPIYDYSYDGVMQSYQSSRQRLQRERIDVLLVHDLGRATHGEDDDARFREFMEGGYRALRELRDSGAVGAIGLGVNEWQVCERVMAHGDFDVFLLAGRYTLLEQSALETFMPECARRNISIIVGGPFNSGILASGTRGPGPIYYNYEPAPPDVIQRVARIEAICDDFKVPLAAAALQFPLRHPQVSSVIPGIADAKQLAAALELMNVAIPNELWDALAPRPRRSPLILLHENDNVLVCGATVRQGAVFEIDGQTVTASVDIPVGHKVARHDMPAGAKVIKYGAPIGSMSAPVARGAHVHLHNMRSDYISSHTREGLVGAH